jgi:hypothetical protein
MRVLVQQRCICLFREHRQATGGMSSSECAKEGRREKNVADRAETHREDVRSGGRVVHGVKVQCER